MTMTDRDRVMYDLKEIRLDESRLDELKAAYDNPETRWYAERRLRAFSAAGLLADAKWNPLLHPRGPDGQFIQKFGWVRWLVDGKWKRGQVMNITEGGVAVREDSRWGKPTLFRDPNKRLYSLPSPKGYIKHSPIPSLGDASIPINWKKTGNQGGSNPGGFYEATYGMEIERGFDVDLLETILDTHGFKEVLRKGPDKPLDPSEAGWNTVTTFVSAKDGRRKVYLRSSLGDELTGVAYDDELGVIGSPERKKALETVRIWQGTSSSDIESVRRPLGKMSGIDSGTEFYIKNTKSRHHANNEVLANDLYELAGVPVPNLYHGDGDTVLSQIVTGSEVTLLSDHVHGGVVDEDIAKQIRENIVIDAWLANWDVAGLVFDNIIISDGVVYRIDTGGALEYRAQGGVKGGAFGFVAGELDTFKDASMNKSAHAVFGNVTLDEQRVGAERLAAIGPHQIEDMVEGAGLDPIVAEKLIARREGLLEKLDVTDPYKVYEPPPITSVVRKVSNKQHYWNPITKRWMAGVITEGDDSAEEMFRNLSRGVAANNMGPDVGDLVRVDADGIPLLYEITGIDTDKNGLPVYLGKSVLDDIPPGKLYVLDNPHAPPLRVIGQDSEESRSHLIDKYRAGFLQWRVAKINGDIETHKTVASVLAAGVGHMVNDDDPPGVDFRPRLGKAYKFSHLTSLKPGSLVYRNYTGEYSNKLSALYRVQASTDNTISLRNLLDGHEVFIDRVDFEDDLLAWGTWEIPDEYTENLLLGMLTRDGLIESAETFDVPPIVQSVVFGVDDDLIPISPPSSPYTSPEEMASIGVKPASSINGLNRAVPADAPMNIGDMARDFGKAMEGSTHGSTEDPPTPNPFEKFLGKSVIFTKGDESTSLPSDFDRSLGIWHVVGVTSDKSWKGEHYARMSLRSPSGETFAISFYLGTGNTNADNYYIRETSLDASIPQTVPTFKADGTIVSEGVVIGTYYGEHGWFRASIHPEFAISGERTSLSHGKKKHLRRLVGSKFIPQLQPDTVPDSARTSALKETVKKTKRSDFKPGDLVKSPDGFIGRVVDDGDLKKGSWPSAVRVENTSGQTVIRDASLLLPITDADWGIDPLPKPAPVAGDLYNGQKLGDGNFPAVGQKIRSKKDGKTSTIVWINKGNSEHSLKRGLIKVILDDDPEKKKIYRTLSTSELVSEAPFKPGTPLKAVFEVKAGFTPEAVADSVIKYMSPDGKLIQQPQYVKDRWLSVSPKRKLTRDGFAPAVGMRVRDSKGKSFVITGFVDKYENPNQVTVLQIPLSGDPSTKRTVSTLYVDHIAELESQVDPKLASVRAISTEHGPLYFPNGTPIYQRSGVHKYDYPSGEAPLGRDSNEYFVVSESGGIFVLGALTQSNNPESYINYAIAPGDMKKVGVIDDTSPLVAAFKHSKKGQGAKGLTTAFVPYDPSEYSHEAAIAGHFVDLASVSVVGTDDPEIFPGPVIKNGTKLAKPLDAGVVGPVGPAVPPVTGVAGDLHARPTVLSNDEMLSVVGAAKMILDARKSTDPHTGSQYGVGDGEHIEDMLVRAQMSIETNTGEEFLELHFRIPEAQAEAVSDTLLEAGSVEYGKWEPYPDDLYVDELKPGDAISVRIASISGFLKPSKDNEPNARVLSKPVLLGKGVNGEDVYRVQVASADGDYGEVDMESRALPSVRHYKWNEHAVVNLTSSTSVGLTPKARDAGWRSVSGIGFDRDKRLDKISVDSSGRKMFVDNDTLLAATQNYGTSKQNSYGSRVKRIFADDSYVMFNAVPSSVGGTSGGSGGSSEGDIRRWNAAGTVTIRVPIAIAEDDDKLRRAISQGMEAVGIPPEAQGPATDEQVKIFALRKAFKTYSKNFTHRETGVDTSNENDPGVSEVLTRMNRVLSPELGRDVTLDDFEIRFFDDGRFQVMLSTEVAKAVSKSQGNTHYTHSLSTDDDGLLEILAGPSPGLMGGEERWSLGLFTGGQSTISDLQAGSGNRVYLYGKGGGGDKGLGGQIHFSATAINKTIEVYMNLGDGWGKRKPANPFISPVRQSKREYMVKRKIVPEQIAYIFMPSKSRRDWLIAQLKKRGISNWAGRPVEEVVVVDGDWIDTTTDEFQELGTEYGEIVTVGGIT